MNRDTIVQLQLEAYNARNLAQFASFYADEVDFYDFESQQIILTGKEALLRRYDDRFQQSPNLHACVISRLSQGDLVIDQEEVHGYMGDNISKAIVMYKVEHDRIRSVWIYKHIEEGTPQ